MPTISPILLDRLSPCTLPVSWLPISGTLSATAFSTSALNAGSTEATRPRIVTSTSSNGNSDTKAEYARLETSTPPLSSPYFLITPKTNAVGVYRRCSASTFLITRSTGFIRAHLAVASATAAPHQGGQTRPGGQPAGPVSRASQPGQSAGPVSRASQPGLEGRVVLGLARVGVVALGHRGGQPGAGAVQPLPAHRREPPAAFPELERLLEGQAARLQALDHRRQLVSGLLVGKRLLGGSARRVGTAVCHAHDPIRRPQHRSTLHYWRGR